ncbi:MULTISPECIES: hypothetical protein [unclassified Clostridium]|nr:MULTISPECIES: hypothetical protein [unclassified Clostridium]
MSKKNISIRKRFLILYIPIFIIYVLISGDIGEVPTYIREIFNKV